ncbi:ABC transporter ATP-binding protein [Mycetocola tolaasinivorans]|uniref:ABC transporter ATP-binding protein n=1 Tax=Mycetocola tolaasinivorans TaxID=76635 RepID=A0A3L6ZXM8_9MICO|nr:ABC transporter ATP-binding protein [Mycetocola tolaasinivorans]RLP72776.1 ABC transporter ATP-binding protein [Mycetocola tolaasinivorans]
MTDHIVLEGVTRRFGAHTALDSVSLRLPAGSICGLLGRNGAGKTTLLSLIAGQDLPSEGTVRVNGHSPFEHAATLAGINLVRDNQRYPDDFDVRNVLSIAPSFLPHWDAELAEQLVAGFRVPRGRSIKKFSRGQLSAVAIILGVASRAPLTLMDEPYLGLDVNARRYFHEVLVRDVAEHPRTVILSTHHVEESESLFDRVLIVDEGRVLLDAGIEDIPDLAFAVSGRDDVIRDLTADLDVLRLQTVPGLASATVRGRADTEFIARAEAAGARILPVSVADLVTAYGTERTPEEARA